MDDGLQLNNDYEARARFLHEYNLKNSQEATKDPKKDKKFLAFMIGLGVILTIVIIVVVIIYNRGDDCEIVEIPVDEQGNEIKDLTLIVR
jgi:hypothetical protein